MSDAGLGTQRLYLEDVDVDGDLDVLAARIVAVLGLDILFFENDGSTLLPPVPLARPQPEFLVDFASLPPTWTASGPTFNLLRTDAGRQRLCRWPQGVGAGDITCDELFLEAPPAGLLHLAVATADMDLDGLDDIVLSRFGASGNRTVVFRQCEAQEPDCGP